MIGKILVSIFLLGCLSATLRPASAQDSPAVSRPISKLVDIRKGEYVDDFTHLFPDSQESAERTNRFRIEQSVELSEIPVGSKLLQLWISLPSEEKNQRLLDFAVLDCPGKWKVVKDVERRGSFLYVELANPQSQSIVVLTSFDVLREPEFTDVVATKSGELTAAMKLMLAEFLVQDAPHMTVTPEFQAIADEVCGKERNLAIQSKLILEHVASTVDHYSYTKDPTMPTCGVGDSAICKKQGGGCCTDLNSYFITLARARGIPARLNMGYRLQEKNRGKLVDPGYRCWVEYFLPNYGWVSADVVEADTPGGLGHSRWLTGLTSRRIWLNQGREFAFEDKSTPGRINNMTIGYAEVDGNPVRLLPEGDLKPQLTRMVNYVDDSK
jgi:transglutaminase-like putative cysteine protease